MRLSTLARLRKDFVRACDTPRSLCRGLLGSRRAMCGVSARTAAPRAQILHLPGQATAWEHVTITAKRLIETKSVREKKVVPATEQGDRRGDLRNVLSGILFFPHCYPVLNLHSGKKGHHLVPTSSKVSIYIYSLECIDAQQHSSRLRNTSFWLDCAVTGPCRTLGELPRDASTCLMKGTQL